MSMQCMSCKVGSRQAKQPSHATKLIKTCTWNFSRSDTIGNRGNLLLPREISQFKCDCGSPIKCNSFAESPNLVQQTGPYSPSLLISCSVTAADAQFLSGLISPDVRDGPFLDQGSDYSFAPASCFPLGLGSAVPGTTIFHLNLRLK
jgi:hypothetical protein